MGGGSKSKSSSSSSTTYKTTTTNNPYVTSTTTDKGTTTKLQPNTALSTVYDFTNNNIFPVCLFEKVFIEFAVISQICFIVCF